jgi:Sec-independent protein secretion pathway component TatC
MAQRVVIGNETFKKRNIVAVWLLLPFITLGIYHFVWYYKINNEARRYLKDNGISPGMSLLAITLGAILVVPPFVSVYKSCSRIQRMQVQAGLTSRIEPVLGLLLTFVFGLHVLYMQSHLNSIWDAHLRSGQGGGPGSPLISKPSPPTVER